MKLIKESILIFLFVVSFMFFGNVVVKAEEVTPSKEEEYNLYKQEILFDGSIFSYYGYIKQKNPIFSDYVVYLTESFEAIGYCTYEKDGATITFEPNIDGVLVKNGFATITMCCLPEDLLSSIKKNDEYKYFYSFDIQCETIEFDGILHCQYNQKEIIQLKSKYTYTYNEYLNKTRRIPSFNIYGVKFYNSMNEEQHVKVEYSTSSYTYGFTKVKYIAKKDGYKDLYGEFILELLPEVKANTIKSTAFALTKNSKYEYKLGENGKWQSSRVFKKLKPNTEYTVYIRTKATKDFPHGTEVSIKVKTLEEE